VGVPWRDTDPRAFRPSPYSVDHVRFAQAITLAYAAIEELGLTVNPRIGDSGTPRAKLNDGTWVPEVLTDIQRRLAASHVSGDQVVYWHRRGRIRRQERARAVQGARLGRWSAGEIRDVQVRIPDALDHARWLRNKATGHTIDSRGQSLSPYEVVNVQGLARTLLMSATRSWWSDYRPILLSDPPDV
jgi:hypothetical protein